MKKIIREHIKANKVIQTLIGDISLEKEIGEGGNGLVFNGEWKKLGVAIKFLAVNKIENKRKLERFSDEISLQIFHGGDEKGIVRVLHFGEISIGENEVPFYVMPLYSQSLKTWHGGLEEEDKISNITPLFRQMLKIFRYFEQNEIVHRDIKPENILINELGMPVIADFGIAWFNADNLEKLAETKKGERMANYLFSAPEQVDGDEPDKKMDFYALGQLVQWFLTGSTHRGTGRVRISNLNGGLAKLDSLVEMLLSQRPEMRPDSVEKIKELLLKADHFDPVAQASEMFDCVIKFDEILRKSFPGKSDLFSTSEEFEIDRFLNNLSEGLEELDLNWTDGEGTLGVREIEKDNGFWVIGNFECLIDRIYVYKTASVDRQFVMISSKASPLFPDNGTNGEDSGYAGFFEGKYISANEHDEGYAEINKEVVHVTGKSKLRMREFKPFVRFYATNYNSVLYSKNDKEIKVAVDEILAGSSVDSVLESFKWLKANPHLSILK